MKNSLRTHIITVVLLTLFICSEVCANVEIRYNPNLKLASHAAQEFANYTKKITGDSPTLIRDTAPDNRDTDTIILIGGPTHNSLTRELNSTYKWYELGDEGFVQKSIRVNNKNYLILGGNTEKATLYAVYDYFEKFCKVGYFWDGENIPKRKYLPVENIDNTEKPFFRDRMHFAWNGHWAPKKYQSMFWTLDDWKREFDWMSKRKLNTIRMDFLVPSI